MRVVVGFGLKFRVPGAMADDSVLVWPLWKFWVMDVGYVFCRVCEDGAGSSD